MRIGQGPPKQAPEENADRSYAGGQTDQKWRAIQVLEVELNQKPQTTARHGRKGTCNGKGQYPLLAGPLSLPWGLRLD